jgi:hypothetical protein
MRRLVERTLTPEDRIVRRKWMLGVFAFYGAIGLTICFATAAHYFTAAAPEHATLASPRSGDGLSCVNPHCR